MGSCISLIPLISALPYWCIESYLKFYVNVAVKAAATISCYYIFKCAQSLISVIFLPLNDKTKLKK